MGELKITDSSGKIVFSSSELPSHTHTVSGSAEAETREEGMKLEDMVREFEGTQRQIEASKARRNPDANRLTKVMRAQKSYCYWNAGKDARGYDVRFCVAHHVNVAGYVLTWKQIEGYNRQLKHVMKRTQWAALRTTQGARNIAERRAHRWCVKHGKPVDGIVYNRVGW